MTSTQAQLAPLVAAPEGPFRIEGLAPDTTPPILLSIVIPTYGEAKNIRELVERLAQLLDPVLPSRYELIVVDDDSPDGTWQLAQQLTAEFPALQVIRRQGERGLSTAVIRGWQAAQGEVLGVIDSDLQHPPETMLDLYRVIERGADLAVATRPLGGWRGQRLERLSALHLARGAAYGIVRAT